MKIWGLYCSSLLLSNSVNESISYQSFGFFCFAVILQVQALLTCRNCRKKSASSKSFLKSVIFSAYMLKINVGECCPPKLCKRKKGYITVNLIPTILPNLPLRYVPNLILGATNSTYRRVLWHFKLKEAIANCVQIILLWAYLPWKFL